jgi:transposase
MTKGSKYPVEFHERAVRLARGTERPIADVARDLGVHPKTLQLWVRQDEADNGSRTNQLATVEREELTALRREVRDLRRANEILKAASVFFARELDQPRPR